MIIYRYRDNIYRYLQQISIFIKFIYDCIHYPTINSSLLSDHIQTYINACETIFKSSLTCLMFIMIIIFPIICILSLYYKTHEYSYAWIVSAIYLTGSTPFLVLLTVMVLFGLFFTSVFHYFYKISQNKYDENNQCP